MRKLLLLLLPLLILGCAITPPAAPPPGPVPEELVLEDPFDASYKVQCDNASGKTLCVMTGNALRPFNPRYPMLSLGMVSEEDKNGSSRFFLRAVYVNEVKWLNIGPASPLVLTMGSVSYKLSGPGSAGARYLGEREKVYEVALYETSSDMIRRIAASKDMVVCIQGDFLLEKRFSTVNQLYFQQFIRHYIDKPRDAAR